MGSEGNKMNDGTSFQPTEPALCANGCGFFGSSATMNLCSKCFRDLRVNEEQAASAKAAMDKLILTKPQSQLDTSSSSLPSVAAAAKVEAEAKVAATAAVAVAGEAAVVVRNRCLSCKKKVGVMGFKCKCGSTFCGTHRYPEKHDCTFDFRSQGKEAIAKANPVVKADRLNQRI